MFSDRSVRRRSSMDGEQASMGRGRGDYLLTATVLCDPRVCLISFAIVGARAPPYFSCSLGAVDPSRISRSRC